MYVAREISEGERPSWERIFSGLTALLRDYADLRRPKNNNSRMNTFQLHRVNLGMLH